MKAQFPWPTAFLAGMALGILSVHLTTSSTDKMWAVFPSLIGACVTLAVGYWIHTTVNQRQTMNQIPVAFLSGLAQRIDEAATAGVDTSITDDDRLHRITLLSNEISSLRRLAKDWSPRDQDIQRVQSSLFAHFLDLKKALTDGRVQMARAQEAKRQIQRCALKLQMSISSRILDGRIPKDVLIA